jgi:hypothetical protein
MIGNEYRILTPYVDGLTLRLQRLHRPRRCLSRVGKKATRYLWMAYQTSYGQRPIFIFHWHRKHRKFILRERHKTGR